MELPEPGEVAHDVTVLQTEAGAVYPSMLRVQRAVGAVAKADRNAQQGFNFRGVDAVVNAVGPALREAGVFLLPTVTRLDYEPVTIERPGKPPQHSVQVRVYVTYRFVAEDGSSVEASVIGEGIDYGDKGVAKAMSVAYRIMLLQVFCIPTDDPDPDSEVYERGAPQHGQQHGQVRPGRPGGAPPAQPPAPPPVDPYSGTDDDFAIDVANLEAAADLDALRDLWKAVKANGRDDQADAVAVASARVRAAQEAGSA